MENSVAQVADAVAKRARFVRGRCVESFILGSLPQRATVDRDVARRTPACSVEDGSFSVPTAMEPRDERRHRSMRRPSNC
jgi:hypothetical protein